LRLAQPCRGATQLLNGFFMQGKSDFYHTMAILPYSKPGGAVP
jgi:hypothetical protein